MADRNEVRIHVQTTHDKGFAPIRTAAKKAGAEAGQDFGSEFTKKAKESASKAPLKVPTTADNPIDAAWRKNLEASLRSTATDALKIPVSPEAEIFKRELAKMMENADRSLHAEIPLEVGEAAEFKRQVETLAKIMSDEVKVRVPVEVDQTKLQKAEKQVDTALDSVAKRANAKFSVGLFAGMFAGLPLAAGASAGLATVALGGVAAGFIGLAAVAVSQNAKVKQSYTDLWEEVKAGAKSAAAPTADEFVDAADQIGASWDRLQPQLATGAQAAVENLDLVTTGVTSLAEEAMPGLVKAAQNSRSSLQGFAGFMNEVGQGADEMFTGLTKGGDGTRKSMIALGGVVRDAEAFLGSFIGNIAAQGTPSITAFRGTLQQMYGVLNTLSTSGFPTVQAAVSGVTGTFGGALTMAQGFVSALGSATAPLGYLGGSLYATNALMGLMGTSIGQNVQGFKNLNAGVDSSGKSVGSFRDQVGSADGVAGKFKAGMSALTNAGVNPLGIALGVVSFALGIFGQKAAEAKQKQAEFDAGVKELRGTLDQTTGAITAKTKAAVSDEAQTMKLGKSQKFAADLAKEYGFSQAELTHIVTTGGSALDTFSSKMKGNTNAALENSIGLDGMSKLASGLGLTTEQLTSIMMGNTEAGINTGNMLGELNKRFRDGDTAMGGLAGSAMRATQGQRDLSQWVAENNRQLAEAQKQLRATEDAASGMGGSMKLSAQASQMMAESLAAVGSDAASAADEAKALLWILDKLSGGNISLSDAQAKSGEALRNAAQAIEAFKNGAAASVGELVNAQGGINGLSEAGGKLNQVFSELSTTALQEASAGFDEVKARGGGLAEQMNAVAAPVQRARDRFIEAADAAGLTGEQAARLANEMGLVPEIAKIQFLAEGDTEVQNKLLAVRDAVVNMPAGTVNMKADAVRGVEEQLGALGYKISALPNGEVRITAPGAPAVQQQITGIVDQVNTMPAGKTLRIDAPTGDVHAGLVALGYTITTLPNGQVEITANPQPALDATGAVREMAGAPIVAPMELNVGGGSATYGGFKSGIESDTVLANLAANAAGAYASSYGWMGFASTAVATSTLGANNSPALGAVGGFIGAGNAASPTGRILATNDQALMSLAFWSAAVRASRPQGTVFANISPAVATWGAWHPGSKTAFIFAKVIGGLSGGGKVGGWSGGGKIRGYPGGGKILGPGTRTSDSVPLWGSKDEYMVNAAQYAANADAVEAINNGTGPIDLSPFANRPERRGTTKAGGNSGGGGGGATTVVLKIESGGARLDDMLVEILQRSVRAQGGNVQLVLGTGAG